MESGLAAERRLIAAQTYSHYGHGIHFNQPSGRTKSIYRPQGARRGFAV